MSHHKKEFKKVEREFQEAKKLVFSSVLTAEEIQKIPWCPVMVEIQMWSLRTDFTTKSTKGHEGWNQFGFFPVRTKRSPYIGNSSGFS